MRLRRLVIFVWISNSRQQQSKIQKTQPNDILNHHIQVIEICLRYSFEMKIVVLHSLRTHIFILCSSFVYFTEIDSLCATDFNLHFPYIYEKLSVIINVHYVNRISCWNLFHDNSSRFSCAVLFTLSSSGFLATIQSKASNELTKFVSKYAFLSSHMMYQYIWRVPQMRLLVYFSMWTYESGQKKNDFEDLTMKNRQCYARFEMSYICLIAANVRWECLLTYVSFL